MMKGRFGNTISYTLLRSVFVNAKQAANATKKIHARYNCFAIFKDQM